MKIIIAAAALAFAAPAFAQSAPAAGQHQGHAQHEGHGQQQGQKHEGHEPGDAKHCCCKDMKPGQKMDCCDEHKAGKSAEPKPDAHGSHH
jgi:hypothetical protein